MTIKINGPRSIQTKLERLSIEFREDAARLYGLVRSDSESRGTPIGPLDNMIAAHTLSLGVTLMTNNVREFSRVTGLVVEDWCEP